MWPTYSVFIECMRSCPIPIPIPIPISIPIPFPPVPEFFCRRSAGTVAGMAFPFPPHLPWRMTSELFIYYDIANTAKGGGALLCPRSTPHVSHASAALLPQRRLCIPQPQKKHGCGGRPCVQPFPTIPSPSVHHPYTWARHGRGGREKRWMIGPCPFCFTFSLITLSRSPLFFFFSMLDSEIGSAAGLCMSPSCARDFDFSVFCFPPIPHPPLFFVLYLQNCFS